MISSYALIKNFNKLLKFAPYIIIQIEKIILCISVKKQIKMQLIYKYRFDFLKKISTYQPLQQLSSQKSYYLVLKGRKFPNVYTQILSPIEKNFLSSKFSKTILSKQEFIKLQIWQYGKAKLICQFLIQLDKEGLMQQFIPFQNLRIWIKKQTKTIQQHLNEEYKIKDQFEIIHLNQGKVNIKQAQSTKNSVQQKNYKFIKKQKQKIDQIQIVKDEHSNEYYQ